jgi:hypothetical protein
MTANGQAENQPQGQSLARSLADGLAQGIGCLLMTSRVNQPLIVVGMHRSGTSVAMEVLSKLGLYPGSKEELIPGDQNNEEGYWENRHFVDLNDSILYAFNLHSYEMRSLPNNWREHPQAEGLTARLRNAIETSYKGQELWGWKDPRTTLVLPVVRTVFEELELRPRFLLVIRHPLDSAKSMNRRDPNIAIPTALGMWQHYTLTALRDLPCEDTHVVFYQDLVDDPCASLTPLVRSLPISPPSDDRWEAARGVIRRDLIHSRTHSEELGWPEPGILGDFFAFVRTLRAQPDEYHAGAHREQIDALWQRWEEYGLMRSYVAPMMNILRLSWQRPDGKRQGLGLAYYGNWNWGNVDQILDAKPGVFVTANFGINPGVIYFRNARLVAENGRTEHFKWLPGYGSQISEQGQGTARIAFCGPVAHAAIKMPPSTGRWTLKAEYYADLSRSAVVDSASAAVNDLMQRLPRGPG